MTDDTRNKLVDELRDIAIYLRFASNVPSKVPNLIDDAADEIEFIDLQCRADPMARARAAAIRKRAQS